MFVRSMVFFCSLLAASWCMAIPQIQHWQTKNGADVYFVESHELPIIDMQIIFDAGSARDEQLKGLALLTSSLLAEGAGGLDANTISRKFEEQGAVFSTDAGYDSSSISLRSLVRKQNFDPALENLKRILVEPDFPQTAIDRQRNRMLVGIQYKKQNPGNLASDAFYAAVYNDHPYAFPNEGTEESLKKITLQDIKSFHEKYYVASNAMLVIVGDVNRKQAEALADDLIGHLKAGSKPEQLPEVKPLQEAKIIEIDHPSAQTHILVGQPGVKRGDPDYFVLYVGNHVLGGGGMVSRLFEEVREKRGLSYSAYSYFSPMRMAGPFAAGLQTKTEQANHALEVMQSELEKYIATGPTAAELEASKKNITGGFPLKLDSNSKIAGYVAMIGFYGLPLDYLETFNNNVMSVTIDQIKEAFKRRLTPESFVTVMVGSQQQEQGEIN